MIHCAEVSRHKIQYLNESWDKYRVKYITLTQLEGSRVITLQCVSLAISSYENVKLVFRQGMIFRLCLHFPSGTCNRTDNRDVRFYPLHYQQLPAGFTKKNTKTGSKDSSCCNTPGGIIHNQLWDYSSKCIVSDEHCLLLCKAKWFRQTPMYIVNILLSTMSTC